jgi:hypothetical protein
MPTSMTLLRSILAGATLAAIGLWGARGAAADTGWQLFNPTGRKYTSELLRPKCKIPHDIAKGQYSLLEDGEEAPYQLEMADGKTLLWAMADLDSGQRRTYRVEARKPKSFPGKVKLLHEGQSYVLDNGLIAVRVPATASGGEIPAPILQVRLPDKRWVGKGFWDSPTKLKGLTATVLGEGPLFARSVCSTTSRAWLVSGATCRRRRGLTSCSPRIATTR